MMTSHQMISTAPQNDAELVGQSLSGNRDAFGQIVSRYQSLICSLAYSATGSLSHSEDLAQDTFVTAWKQLRGLREPEKLRAWLCGIARNLIHNSLRKQGREPSHRAEPLEEISAGQSPEPLPLENTISKEEAAILWRALERIPETYREPLILFYREHQSIETVAANLELTEDAVKQRLSRGRKLLQEQFLAFVEGALSQTGPGPAFTLSVLSALPALTFSAKAATFGVAVAKGGAAAKSAGIAGVLGAVVSPLLIVFGNYASYRMNMDEAHSDKERKYIRTCFLSSLLVALVLSTVFAAPLFATLRGGKDASLFWGLFFSQTVVIYFLTICVFIFASLRQRRRYLAGILTEQYAGDFPKPAFEYRSQSSLFGLPLVHVRIGDRFDVVRGPVKAWIAVGGSHTIGVIFASGGLAIAPISFGGIAIGLLPMGAITIGIFAYGACCLGVWAYGAAAVGWQVFCGCGIAWNAAMGGRVLAHDFAVGGIAHAAQANTQIAFQYVQNNFFFRICQGFSKHSIAMMAIWIVPVTLQARIVARARRRREQSNS